MSHFIEKCKKCKRVISQCRCPGPKEERWSLCTDCEKKAEDEMVSDIIRETDEQFIGTAKMYQEAAEEKEAQAVQHEALAEYAHNAWAGWMNYLFEKSEKNKDGTVTIPKWAVDRWERQASTMYADLPEEEKKSDRLEANTMLKIMKED